ncbi:two-component system response regulator [Thiorhodococcus mannitoliphagus]|uniref:Two-component system response regulator n=1 Tax=Thiorhodococcus mannitoliphagus TaxID=329406 RepID=A0A6P1DV13_9GAMM|nr:two-component system response regulator [Thiorhodococcus mannitoliphagus]NEX21938.1 two-component system response regulator [Thiorhodococcus mannitoliphagus]
MLAAQSERATVLVVDDTPANLSLLAQILKADYRVRMANNGQRALELAFRSPPDIILCDVMMPGINGFEVCRQLKANPATARVPVIFVTAAMDVEDEQTGFEVGAVDYIHKPLTPAIVLARLRTQIQMKRWQDFMENQSAWLQEEVSRQVDQVLQLQAASIHVMVSLAEFRDEETGNHIRRTQGYVRLLGRWMLEQGIYPERLTVASVDQIAQAAPLHDVGKIAIPDHILLKPERLTPEEFAVMKTHATRGFEILEQARKSMGEDNPLLIYASEITRYHHERWDGSGYPEGLSGESIPLSARLMAVADVYDALRSSRPYKKPFTHEVSSNLIAEGSNTHFDPKVVDAFMAVQDEFAEIAESLADE